MGHVPIAPVVFGSILLLILSAQTAFAQHPKALCFARSPARSSTRRARVGVFRGDYEPRRRHALRPVAGMLQSRTLSPK